MDGPSRRLPVRPWELGVSSTKRGVFSGEADVVEEARRMLSVVGGDVLQNWIKLPYIRLTYSHESEADYLRFRIVHPSS
ncbi:hypothetical protein CORC01_09598 [Colletotrichum orchidophilum]|uniref:Uncharacterized protein n=1 Tax=Colletotrichum orchidophilum TaxID=1209926 RepID=A0A1G4B102_9PEZI|nr:uncharacterized protein CORC01_09598 [Colletotrichum orchidophilum]OHE95074.1 hypothetical protein CORC01_09598 [Colletotrichum orchidophilum]